MTTLPDPVRQALDKRLIRRPGWPPVASAAFRQLLRAWAGWRRGAVVPNRDDMNLAEVTACLPEMIMIRRHADDFRYAVVGEGIRHVWGQSFMGRTPRDLWGPEIGTLVTALFHQLLDEPALALQIGGLQVPPGATNPDQSPKHADRLFLPLRDANGAGYGLLSMSEYRFVPPSGDAVDGVPQDMVSVYACAPFRETQPE